jgi:hypothetical protein
MKKTSPTLTPLSSQPPKPYKRTSPVITKQSLPDMHPLLLSPLHYPPTNLIILPVMVGVELCGLTMFRAFVFCSFALWASSSTDTSTRTSNDISTSISPSGSFYSDLEYLSHLPDLLATCRQQQQVKTLSLVSPEECRLAEYIHSVRNEIIQLKAPKSVDQNDLRIEILSDIPFPSLFENYVLRGRSYSLPMII